MENREVLVELRHLKKFYAVNKGLFSHKQKGIVKAVNDVNLNIYRGETMGLIGESGCGKSTLSRVILGLTDATEGEVLFKGEPVNRQNMKAFRRGLR